MYKYFEKLCLERGVSAYQVAKETGISQATLSNWKNNGACLRNSTLKKIADYFGVSVNYFLQDDYPLTSPNEQPILEKGIQKLVDMYSSLDAENKDQVMRYVTSLYYVDRANKSAQYSGALAAYEGGTQQHTVSKEAAEKVLRRLDDMEKNT